MSDGLSSVNLFEVKISMQGLANRRPRWTSHRGSSCSWGRFQQLSENSGNVCSALLRASASFACGIDGVARAERRERQWGKEQGGCQPSCAERLDWYLRTRRLYRSAPSFECMSLAYWNIESDGDD
jgi:hypothetical protein